MSKHIVRLQYVYILHFLVSINTSNIIVAGMCVYNVDHACIFSVLKLIFEWKSDFVCGG